MTEQEWLACKDPCEMQTFFGHSASRRKMRLFMCNCCRRVWPLISDQRSYEAVELAEKHIEGEVGDLELSLATVMAESSWRDLGQGGDEDARLAAAYATRPDSFKWAAMCAASAADALYDLVNPLGFAVRRQEVVDQAAMMRCIFGNPFRVMHLDPCVLTTTVVALAQEAYRDRNLYGFLDPARLDVLADALEEAGCLDTGVLTHLRGTVLHVRGCWVVDRCLGRS